MNYTLLVQTAKPEEKSSGFCFTPHSIIHKMGSFYSQIYQESFLRRFLN